MRLTLEITGEGAAFDEAPATELARLLDGVARRIRYGEDGGSIRDANGNTCGHWAVRD